MGIQCLHGIHILNAPPVNMGSTWYSLCPNRIRGTVSPKQKIQTIRNLASRHRGIGSSKGFVNAVSENLELLWYVCMGNCGHKAATPSMLNILDLHIYDKWVSPCGPGDEPIYACTLFLEYIL